jgi:hypothetical protein
MGNSFPGRMVGVEDNDDKEIVVRLVDASKLNKVCAALTAQQVEIHCVKEQEDGSILLWLRNVQGDPVNAFDTLSSSPYIHKGERVLELHAKTHLDMQATVKDLETMPNVQVTAMSPPHVLGRKVVYFTVHR